MHVPDSHKLENMFMALGQAPKQQIEHRLKEINSKIRDRLRDDTSLALPSHYKLIVDVPSEVPERVAEILERMPVGLLWALANLDLLGTTAANLERIAGDKATLESDQNFRSLGVREADFQGVARVLRDISASTEKRCKDILEEILGLGREAYVLGTYHSKSGKITVYWCVIWLIAHKLKVAPEDLAEVILVHEVAHAYTHLGLDSDQRNWTTEKFQRCDSFIKEGLAQYYTRNYVAATRAEAAFQALLKFQDSRYTAFLDWPVPAKYPLEPIRSAMLWIRQLDNAKHIQFVERLRDLSRVTE